MNLQLVLQTVGATLQLIGELGKLVDKLSGGLFGKGAASQEAQAKLAQVQASIREIGKLGEVARAYATAHDEVRHLLFLSERAEQFLRDNVDVARTRGAAEYSASWQLMATWFDTLATTQDAVRKNVLDRSEWYDDQDRNQIGLLLTQFTAAYNQASTAARNHLADELLHHLREMSARLRDADSLLRNTLYDKVFRAIQGLRG